MKINVLSHIKTFKGEDLLDETTKKPIEIRDIIANAIVTEDQEHRLTSEKKTQAFQIGIKLWSGKEVDFTIEQMAFIKERVGYFFNALVFGRISELFDKK